MRKKLLSVSILLMVATLACNLSSLIGEETPPPIAEGTTASEEATPPPTIQEATPSPPPTQSDILFQDDFSDPSSGWEEEDYPSGSVGYKDGFYFVTSSGNGDSMWGVANCSFGDLSIEVDAEQISAPANDNNDYGVACRVQPNGDGYYFLISGDGGYAVLKAVNDAFNTLVDWSESDIINQGDAQNHLRAVCAGSKLELFANGQRLATTADTTFTRGDIALTATSYEDEPTEIHFDNLVVHRP